MKDYFEFLQTRLDAVLGADSESCDIEKYRMCVDVLDAVIREMEADVEQHPFETMAEEIRYYRKEAPRVYGRFFFYIDLMRLEQRRDYLNPPQFCEYLRDELHRAQDFLIEKAHYRHYSDSSQTYMDQSLYVRREHGEWSTEEPGLYIKENFCVGAYWLSHLYSKDQLSNWITAELDELDRTRVHLQPIECTAKAVDLVELFKAAHLIGWFGNKPFKNVIEWVRAAFSARIRDQDKILCELCSRKISQTKCLDDLREILRRYLDAKT